MMRTILDRKGKEVREGSKVRVVHIDELVLKSLPPEEVEDVKSMFNDTLVVYEIDSYGQAWVEKWWDRDENRSESHSLALSPNEIELIENDS